MKLVELTKNIVEQLVDDAELVTVKEFPSENEDEIIIQVMVPENQIGKVIGKQGRLAQSIRTVMKAVAGKEQKKVTIEFIG